LIALDILHVHERAGKERKEDDKDNVDGCTPSECVSCVNFLKILFGANGIPSVRKKTRKNRARVTRKAPKKSKVDQKEASIEFVSLEAAAVTARASS